MSNFTIYAGLIGTSTSSLGDLVYMNGKARAAKALFNTPKATAPWTQKTPDTPLLVRANAIARLTHLFDTTAGGPAQADPDVDLSFAAYGALDKLLTLAKASAEDKTDAATRTKLAERFDKGIEELQDYLATTHGTKLNIGFDRLKSTAESFKVKTKVDTAGQTVSAQRADVIAGLTGTEKIAVTLTKAGRTDTVVADLSTVTGPLTLDAVAGAINTAIKSVPLLAADGTPTLDSGGQPVARYLSQYQVTKQADGRWGLALQGVETERVSLSDPGASSSLVVVSGLKSTDSPTTGRVLLFDDPAAGLSQHSLAELTAVDGDATAMASKLAQEEADAAYDKKVADARKLGLRPPPRPADAVETVLAQMAPKATATDKFGNIFVVGETTGDLGQQRNDGVSDLFLSKLDADGNVLWQRLIGSAAPTRGAAIAVDANGDVVVAGTTEGALTSKDQLEGADSFVAKFRANGDDVFTTQLDGAAIDEASSLAIDGSGRIYLAGSVRGALPGGTGLGGRDGYLVQLDATGAVKARRQVGTAGEDKLSAMTLAADGSVLLAVRQGTTSALHRLDGTTLASVGSALDLGDTQVTSLAVDKASGRVAIGGTTTADVTGAVQANARAAGTDGFVMLADADLGNATVRYLGTAATDSVDSLAFLGGKLYAGGRTGAVLGTAKVGNVDGFVARLDLNGGLEKLQQFGRLGTAQEAVLVAASASGSTALSKIGLRAGDQSQAVPTKLIGQTSLREGDHFFLRLDGDRKIKVEIKADDTFETLATRIRVATFNRVKATVSNGATGASLKLAMRSGVSVDVMAGADGHDALEKMGLEPTRLYTPKVTKGANVIQPGGTFALELDDALAIHDKQSAGFVVKKLEAAIKTTQSAFRSLYWDDTKARIASGLPNTPALDARQSAQIKAYKLALARLGG